MHDWKMIEQNISKDGTVGFEYAESNAGRKCRIKNNYQAQYLK